MNNKTIESIVELTKAIREKKEAGVSDTELENFIKEQVSKLSPEQVESKTVVDPSEVKDINAILSLPTNDDRVKRVQELNDSLILLSTITKVSPKKLKLYDEFKSTLKSLYTTNTGGGAEYIPTGFSPRLWDRIRLELKVAKIFTEIDMPTNPYSSPVVLGDTDAYYVPESTSDDLETPASIPSSNPTTGKFTLDAKKIATKVRLSDEISEDSVVPILPMLETNIVTGIAKAIENAIINGDTALSPMDADLTASSDPRKAFDGLRKLTNALCKIDLSSESDLLSGLRAMRASMGVYGVNPSDLVFITSIAGYLKGLLKISDLATVDKYGMNAVILTGEVGRIDGVPVVVSEVYKQNLDDSGVVPVGLNGTDTAITLVNKKAFVLGNRREVKVVLGDDIENDQKILVASVRKAFTSVYGSAVGQVAYGYALLGANPIITTTTTSATTTTP